MYAKETIARQLLCLTLLPQHQRKQLIFPVDILLPDVSYLMSYNQMTMVFVKVVFEMTMVSVRIMFEITVVYVGIIFEMTDDNGICQDHVRYNSGVC